uniref:Uncharacterized protein n=1 Tax=Spongospora subterranea TaxID=70186 RepID=A0A0H5R9H2_9EUKA|eukprot:CRZ05066.1 hypothetical protein [Spongospora subterranea]
MIQAYQTFYQNFTGASVLMTDGASAFETAACELRLRHLLFMRDCHSVLCTIFDSEVSFLDFFNTFYARLAGDGDALRFLSGFLIPFWSRRRKFVQPSRLNVSLQDM